MAVEYAKIMHRNDDNKESSYKLKVFLINDGQQVTNFLEWIVIFGVFTFLLILSNQIFQKFYSISGQLMD